MHVKLKASKNAKPDFGNIRAVLNKDKPSRPTLFEFFLNRHIYEYYTGKDIEKQADNLSKLKIIIEGYEKVGYDFAIIPSWLTHTLEFPKGEIHKKDTHSLNEGQSITDEESFEAYHWPDPKENDYSLYEQLAQYVPEGMKLISTLPGGVLENVIDLVGFERLCIMSLENPHLSKQVFNAVGSRLFEYYKIIASFDHVGAMFVNDDWGFKTQTMLPPESMREYVFPWHKALVETIHQQNKPAILHSCGNINEVMDDVIDDMNYDGKHSFEDGIVPVEEAYNRWCKRIAVLGGIDVDYLTRRSPNEIKERSRKMLETGHDKGGYALGSGNSIPEYIPLENYQAMISVVNEV